MITLRDNRTALVNIAGTIDALENLELLIKTYSEDKPGPAYVRCAYVGDIDIQIDRAIMVTALEAQRQRLISYLATLGIDANS